MSLVRVVFDRATTTGYATVVAQIVPVLLLAAVVVPLRVRTKPGDAARAFRELILTGVVVAVALATEIIALFGVLQGGLTNHDVQLMTWLLFATAALATLRMLVPLVSAYSTMSGAPEGRILGVVSALITVVFVVVFLTMNALVA